MLFLSLIYLVLVIKLNHVSSNYLTNTVAESIYPLNATLINLSWRRITGIDEAAFNNFPNLHILQQFNFFTTGNI